MAGFNLKSGTGTHADKVLTVDENGKVGTGDGNEINANFLTAIADGNIGDSKGNYRRTINSEIILETGNQGTFSPFNLGDYTTASNHVYEIHCLASNTGADTFTYERFIFIEHINYSKKVDSTGNGGHSFAIDGSGTISESGGGNREFTIRIKQLM